MRGYDGCPVNFVSWNVKSLNHPVKFKKVFSRLKRLNTDIAFLQAIHIQSGDSAQLVRGWAGQVCQSNFHSKARGVAIMIRKNFPFIVSNVQTDSWGQYVIVVGKLHTLPVIFACIYAPNWDDQSISKRASSSKSAHSIQLFLETYGVVDVWQSSHLQSIFLLSPVRKTYSCIDYFFPGKRILHIIKQCEYGAIVISDHGPLNMKMDIAITQSTYRLW